QEPDMTTIQGLSRIAAAGALCATVVRVDASAQPLNNCEQLASFSLPNASMSVTSATRVDAGKFVPPGGRRGAAEPYADLGAFCRIVTTTPVTPASTGRTEIWLPIGNWNREHQPAGGGFYGGTMPYARMREILRR